MPILNYTTSITVEKTVGEVSKILAKQGASRVSTDYDSDGQATGLSFMLRTPHGERLFDLPVNIAGVFAALKSDREVQPRFKTMQHAERVAWRIAKDWLEAQVALIAAGMASLDQVMLPYLVVADGMTLYANYKAREESVALQLTAGDTSTRAGAA